MSDGLAEIEAKIADAVAQWNMLPAGCRVVVGLSGGADSVTLAHFLLHNAEKYGIELTAAHVNHGLRGKEADSDEEFVRSFCKSNNLKLDVLHADVRAIAKEKSQGIEECGRKVRYSYFHRLCGENGRIATAHTLSDLTETVFINLAKGAGTRGLCGIPPVRGNIIRPLITLTRTEVECYCTSYGLNYVTDSTNLTAACTRNRIRLEVVPVLKQVNPEFENSVLRTVRILHCDEEYFERLAQEKMAEAVLPQGGYTLDVLRKTPRALLLRVIPLAISQVDRVRLEFGHIEAVEKIILSGTGAVTVAGRIQCRISGNTLFVEKQQNFQRREWSVPLCPNGTVLPDGRVLSITPVLPDVLKNHEKINNLLFNNLINYDTILNIGGVVRNRRPGDAYRPAGRGVTKTLKKLCNEAKIPAEKRSNLTVLECGGEIVWVEGFGASQKAGIADNKKNIAEITIKECR